MKVQRARRDDRVTWLVLDEGYRPLPEVTRFLLYLEGVGRSPNTVRSYAYHLALYFRFLGEKDWDWRTVDLEGLAAFMRWLLMGGRDLGPAVRSDATVNCVMAAVTVFYEFHGRLGDGPELPLYRLTMGGQRPYKGLLHHVSTGKPQRRHLLRRKERHVHPQTLDAAQVAAVLAACEHRRDLFLVRLLHDGGLRIGEVLGLRHEDIHAPDNQIRVVRRPNANGALAKGWRERVVDVGPDLMRLYGDYLLYEVDDIESDYVFVNLWQGERGRPMTYAGVTSLFRRLSRKSGVPVHPHMFRHTHATQMLRAKVPAVMVQQRLGHASIQTTLDIYAHLDDADLKREYQAYRERTGKGDGDG